MRILVLLVLSLIALPVRAQDKEPVDLLLVLAADISSSVNERKFFQQRRGYADALTDPRVVQAATSGIYKKIALLYFEWSDPHKQSIIVDWSLMRTSEDAYGIASKLLTTSRPFYGNTAIGAALMTSLSLFDQSPYTSTRKVIDISGDGTNNEGMLDSEARDIVLKSNIVINGLAILTMHEWETVAGHTNPMGGLEAYYRAHVTGGPGSFVMAAKGHNLFKEAILAKLIREIALR